MHLSKVHLTLYHNCVYEGTFCITDKICPEHILIRKPLTCLFMYQLKFTNCNKYCLTYLWNSKSYCPIPLLILLHQGYYNVIYFLL